MKRVVFLILVLIIITGIAAGCGGGLKLYSEFFDVWYPRDYSKPLSQQYDETNTAGPFSIPATGTADLVTVTVSAGNVATYKKYQNYMDGITMSKLNLIATNNTSESYTLEFKLVGVSPATTTPVSVVSFTLKPGESLDTKDNAAIQQDFRDGANKFFNDWLKAASSTKDNQFKLVGTLAKTNASVIPFTPPVTIDKLFIALRFEGSLKI